MVCGRVYLNGRTELEVITNSKASRYTGDVSEAALFPFDANMFLGFSTLYNNAR